MPAVESEIRVGVLALQGGFPKHIEKLSQLSVRAILVRYPHELAACDGLIMPGGESTVITKLLHESGLWKALENFSRPIFATCAGMIVLAKMGKLSLAIQRNAFGRQCESFSTSIQVNFPEGEQQCEAVFIRAPRIMGVLSNKVKVLATLRGEPVLVTDGNILAATFHPELTEDLAIHRFFLYGKNGCIDGSRESCLQDLSERSQ